MTALIQTAVVVGKGLVQPGGVTRIDDDSVVYLVAVIAWIVLMIAVGVGVFALLARPGGSGAVVAVGLATVALDAWIVGFARPVGDITSPGFGVWVAHWLPAVVVGAAIGAAGLRTWHRVVGAVVALVVLWIGTSALGGLVAAAGSRALLRLPGELASTAAAVFQYEVVGESLRLAGVAAACGMAGLGVRFVVVRLRSRSVTA